MKLDITNKLTLDRPELEVCGLVFPVDNTKSAMLAFDDKMNALPERAGEALLYETAVRHFLGDAAAEKLDELGLSVPGWRMIFLGIMALVQEVTLEEVQARFQSRPA